MWCIPRVDAQFIERMEDVCDLYAKPYNPHEPVLCLDEKSKQLPEETRAPISITQGHPQRRDYEYRRNGTANLFVTVEPKGGHRECTVTDRRTKRDFAEEIRRIISLPRYRRADIIHIVLDNLNTHFASSFHETFGDHIARRLLKRIRFHHTPKHASWLNMAEIELSILGRQCLNRRISTTQRLIAETAAWMQFRNMTHATIQWKFTVHDAQRVFQDYY